MATSGTIGTTVISTAKLIEKAFRRIGLGPQLVTPEYAENAREDLFMLIMSLSNRGLNLWCIDQQTIPLVTGQKTYVLPPGTLDVLNLLQVRPFRLDYQEDYGVNEITVDFLDDTKVNFAGFKFDTLPTQPITIQSSDDGLVWTTLAIVAVADLSDLNTYTWVPLPLTTVAKHYRATSLDIGDPVDFFLSSTQREIPLTPFNRDDYASQPDKNFLSLTQTNYFFEKLVDPQITLWPVPENDSTYLHLFRYRQIQDVGSLTDQLEIPSRWYEAICWHLSARLAFELPEVDPARRQEVVQMANSMVIEVESGETDSSPTFFAPNIRCYTR